MPSTMGGTKVSEECPGGNASTRLAKQEMPITDDNNNRKQIQNLDFLNKGY